MNNREGGGRSRNENKRKYPNLALKLTAFGMKNVFTMVKRIFFLLKHYRAQSLGKERNENTQKKRTRKKPDIDRSDESPDVTIFIGAVQCKLKINFGVRSCDLQRYMVFLGLLRDQRRVVHALQYFPLQFRLIRTKHCHVQPSPMTRLLESHSSRRRVLKKRLFIH